MSSCQVKCIWMGIWKPNIIFNHHLLFWANCLKWTEPQIFVSCQPARPEILLRFQADNMFCSVGCYNSYQCLLKSCSN